MFMFQFSVILEKLNDKVGTKNIGEIPIRCFRIATQNKRGY